ncbi:MAG: hypothetical protein AAGB93_09650 [Planctomycetota bacterium]
MTSKKSQSSKSPARKSTTSKKAASAKRAAASAKPAKGGARKPDEMPEDVLEFIQAIDDYKRQENRPFPTWSEILDIVKSLGYGRKAG